MTKMFASSLYVQTHECRLLNFSFQYKTMLKVYVTKKKLNLYFMRGVLDFLCMLRPRSNHKFSKM